MAIERLNQGDFAAGSQIPFNDTANGSDRRGSVTALAALIGTLLGFPAAAALLTQYAAPNATGFGVTISPTLSGGAMGSGVWLLLTPTGGFAAGTITLPAQAECINGQEVLVSCTQAVTTLTVGGNGATVNGAPTTLAANAFFRLRFDGVAKAWYRVG